jgi:hypothetical protein
MMKRIREQLEVGAGFKNAGVLKVSATAVLLPSTEDDKTLEGLVEAVADQIMEMAQLAVDLRADQASGNGNISAAATDTKADSNGTH